MTDNNNPIKYSDLVQPDNSISDLIKQLDELGDVYMNTLKNIKSEALQLSVTLKTVSGATEEGRKTIRKTTSDADRLTKAQRDLMFAESERAKELELVRKATREANEMNRLAARLADSAEGSYNRLSAQYSINKIALNNMTAEYRDNTVEGQKLVKETANIYDQMKRLQSETGKNQLNVGNYGDALKGVTDNADELTEVLGLIPGASAGAAGGLNMVSNASKALLKNPIILMIAGIVAGLTGLIALFKRTQTGADLFAKSGAALSGILSALTGVVDRLAKFLMAAFENPQKAMRDFWNALKQNVINRLTSVIDLVRATSRAFDALWRGDLEGVKNAAKDAGTALIQMNTGLDAEQQKAFAQSVRDTTKAIIDQAQAFADLEAARRQTRRANRELEKQLENIITAEENVKAIADDQTRSFKEREDAAERAAKLLQQRSSLQVRIARENLALINQEVDLRRANGEEIEDLLDQQLQAYKELRGAERDYTNSVNENTKRQSELKQDRLERDLDILIDGFDNQKTINERILKDETRTFEEREALLMETARLFEETFKKQIETIQQFTGVQVDANDLIAESDAVVLNQKIRSLGLSEIIEGRLLEIIRERRTMTQDLAEAEKELNDSKSKAEQKALDDAKKRADEEAKARKEVYDIRVRELDVANEIANYEIDLLEASERKKTELRLNAEKERIAAIIALNKAGNKQLTDEELKAAKLAIAVIDKEIRDNARDNLDIYDIFGLDLSDEKKEAIAVSTQFAMDAMNTFLQAKIEAANQAVEAADAEVDATQRRLDAELEARANGYANNVVMAQKEFDLAKKNQDKALKEQQRAQKAQAAIQTIQQIGNLVTATAQIWAQLGFPWAIPAIAVMWGSFAFAKIKAGQLAKQNTESYGDGTVELLQGGSHQSGNDIDLGTKPDGTRRRAEGGEYFAVINKRNSRRYRGLIPGVIKSLNNGTFGERYLNAFRGDGLSINVDGKAPEELKQLSSDVREIKEQGRRKYFTNGKGQTVMTYKNLKRTFLN